MKLSITILLLIPVFVNAQLRLMNKSLTTPDSSILYKYFDNELQFNKAVDLSKLEIVANHSEIEIKDTIIICTPTKLGTDTLRIFQNKKLILKQAFVIYRIYDPILKFANCIQDSMSVAEILANPYLSIQANDCKLKNRQYILKSFTILILPIRDKKKLITYPLNNSILSGEVLCELKKLYKGDIIMIDEIKLFTKNDESEIRKLPIRQITIK